MRTWDRWRANSSTSIQNVSGLRQGPADLPGHSHDVSNRLCRRSLAGMIGGGTGGSPYAQHEAAGVRHAARRRGGRVAARRARAAARRIAKIGHLESGLPSSSPNLLAAFRQGLRELGYVEGQNLFIERRYAEGREERLPQLAEELVQFGVDIIFAIGPPQALAAAKATDQIPIVFVGGGDPVAMGLVKSLAQPGGNLTGLTFVTVELASKRMQLLKDAVPDAKRVAVLWNPSNVVNKLELENATTTAEALGLTPLPVEIRVLDDIDGAFGAMTRQRADAALVLSSPLTFPNRPRIVESALRARMPTLGALREYAEAGVLMSYGPSYADHCRRAATYVDQIFKGAKPADLPVQLPTTFELVINLKTAKALGLEVPPTLLARADEVIE